MEKETLLYLCQTMGNLCGVPLRLYENGAPVYRHFLVNLPADPMDLCAGEIGKIRDHVGFCADTWFDYYAVVNAGPWQVVVGPTRQVESSDAELRQQAFLLGISSEETPVFLSGMKSIVRMPLESILQMMCALNCMLNGEQLSLRDITVREEIPPYRAGMMQDPSEAEDSYPYDTYSSYDVEQQLMEIIERGDSAMLSSWAARAPAIRPGLVSSDQLRQLQNVFIVSTTLACRAAIRGGLDQKTAFTLSDMYIRKAELLKDAGSLTDLQFQMVTDYTGRVDAVRIGDAPSELSVRAAGYVLSHLSEMITIDDLCAALYISRSRLTARFRAETGRTVAAFITEVKMEEAKRLLCHTNRPLAAIADYLGYSSQSHFSRVFKHCCGLTPHEYRVKSPAGRSE